MNCEQAQEANRFKIQASIACIVALGWVAVSPSSSFAQNDPVQRPSDRGPLRAAPLGIPNTSLSIIDGGDAIPDDATAGRLPEPLPLPYGPDRAGNWSVTDKTWTAPVYCHYPTYYEDMMLERHGHERCPPLQPFISGGRFLSGIFFTPYLVTLQHPLSETPSAGGFRPGSAAPALRQQAPYDKHAIGAQMMATGTGVLLLQP